MSIRLPASSLRVGLLLALAVSLAACSGKKEKETYVDAPVEQLYNDATDLLIAENYKLAAALFDEVDRQHPYSVWAAKAELMAAYAHYERHKYDDAISALERFIQLHPGNRDAAYAYYLKAICYYEQIEDVGRDQGMTQNALDGLQDVVRRFPDSIYARDARVKLDLTRDHLAGKEMEVGRWYLKQGQYVAAINRFRRVIEVYQTTTHVPEALERLTEAYLAIGVREEAQNAAAVLGYNFPGSDWYKDSYSLLQDAHLAPKKDPDSWLSKTWKSVF
jgi:outer membrane protein assembly factor BamD